MKSNQGWKWFTDRINTALDKIVEIFLTILFASLEIGVIASAIGSIFFGIQNKIAVPIYLVLILTFFSVLGVGIISFWLIGKISFKKIKTVNVRDTKFDNRIWKVKFEFIDGEWNVLSIEIYCTDHNLQLPTKLLNIQDIDTADFYSLEYFGKYYCSSCSECGSGYLPHCIESEKNPYLLDIEFRAKREVDNQ